MAKASELMSARRRLQALGRHLTLFAAVLALSSGDASAQTTVRESRPPVRDFFDKYVDCGGIFVRSARGVEDRALQLACGKVTTMLARASQAKANLLEWQAELHIIGRDQQTSDLPELRSARGQDWDKSTHQDIDQRTRGVGGLYSSCGEENLLGLPTDRYRGGSDICVHEFAHAFTNFGLDATLRREIEAQYLRAKDAGLWKGLYAMTNPQEYWAELSMWYFGAHGDRGTFGPPPGATALGAYDAGGYALLDRIYTGAIRPTPIRIAAVRAVDASTPVRSIASSAAATLVLFNNTSTSYSVQWIDFKGQPVSYRGLDRMSYRELSTFVTHAWELTDLASGHVGRFVVDAPSSRWRIGD
jgi:hypothetical protein